jgi:hypothetical protein
MMNVRWAALDCIEAEIDGVLMMVPDDMANRHRRMIAEWEADGNVIAPYVEVPAQPGVPFSVTPAQAQIVLYEAGLLEQVDAAMSDPDAYRPMTIWYNKATAYERGSPYIQAMGYELGLTDEQMDEMFIAAAARTSA